MLFVVTEVVHPEESCMLDADAMARLAHRYLGSFDADDDDGGGSTDWEAVDSTEPDMVGGVVDDSFGLPASAVATATTTAAATLTLAVDNSTRKVPPLVLRTKSIDSVRASSGESGTSGSNSPVVIPKHIARVRSASSSSSTGFGKPGTLVRSPTLAELRASLTAS